MSFAAVINALALPKDALVEQRVPKKLLLERGAPTPADKRKIQDGIEEMIWIAALKPTNIGVAPFTDAEREYLEIAVLTVTLRSTAKPSRLIELIHRAIPYPIVLVCEIGNTLIFSLAHKRWSKGEIGNVVIEDVRNVSLNPGEPTADEVPFFSSIAISQLPSSDLYALYEGLLGRVAALEAARIAEL